MNLIEEQLQNYYKNFHAATLTAKAVYLEPILFPLKRVDTEQLKIVHQLIDDFFPVPTEATNAMDENGYARLIINTYLNAAERREKLK